MKQENKSEQIIPYVRDGDYYFPDLALPPDIVAIGLRGRRRRDYLREHHPILFNQMALVGAMNNIRTCAEEIVYAELVYA